MKVVHLINTLSAGGAELHLLTLCRHMKQQGVDVVVDCLREHVKGSRSLHNDFEKEGIRVVHFQAGGWYDRRSYFGVVHLLRKEQAAILHTYLPRADIAGALGRFFCPAVAWVCSVHAIFSLFPVKSTLLRSEVRYSGSPSASKNSFLG